MGGCMGVWMCGVGGVGGMGLVITVLHISISIMGTSKLNL